jgi:hypothetical protein
MPKKIRGRFYFKKTTNKNLVGEWSNNGENRVFTESSDLDEPVDGYSGTYNSTWQEQGEAISSRLKITIKGAGPLFSLEWRVDGAPRFQGEAMLCDDILIGDYWSVP